MSLRLSLATHASATAVLACGLAAHAQLNYSTNWIGNSLPGTNVGSNNLVHIPLDIQGIYTTPDGTVYTNSGWDEGGRAVSIFKDGQITSPGASNAGGPALVVTGNTIYASQSAGQTANPPCSQGGCGVTILDATSLNSTGASLSGDSSVSSTGSPNIFGMAVSGDNLYVAVNDQNKVDVFSISSNSLVTSYSITSPMFLAVDSQGGLWVSHRDQTTQPNVNGIVYDIYTDLGLSTIDHYGNDGSYIETITLPDSGEVSALSIDGNDNLYVGDQGPDLNIKIYSNILNGPSLSSTLGGSGGVYGQSDPGLISPSLFHGFGITGIGTDSSGNIYVSQGRSGSGADIASYTPSGSVNWQLSSQEFVSIGSTDPTSESDFYDAYHHFKVDYSQAPGNIGTFYADTFDPFAYPTSDVRVTNIAASAQVQYIQGQKFLLVSNQNGGYFAIYRFNSGSEIAIPCVVLDYGSFQQQYVDLVNQPLDGEFIWSDQNGDGIAQSNEFSEPSNNTHRDGQDWWMDSNGDIWQVNYNSSVESSIHIRRYRFQGFDSYGAPIYNYSNVSTYDQPNDFPDLSVASRVIFQPGDSAGGTLYIAGSSSGVGAFSQVARYDNWDQGNRTAAWVANIPSSPNSIIPNSFAEVGNYFFVDYNTPHYISVYSTTDGSYVGELDAGDNVGGNANIGNDDIWTSIYAYQRSNGQYVITKEEDYQAKLLEYVWTPGN